MAELFIHPELETKAVYLQYPDLKVDGKLVSTDQIQEWYESGVLIVLKDFRVEFDSKLIASLDSDNPERFPKKAGQRAVRHHFFPSLLSRFSSRHLALRSQMTVIQAQLMEIANRLFPRYHRLDEKITWRLTEQVNENMHIDTYGAKPMPAHQLRIFVNLDLGKRIWNIGYPIDEVYRRSIDALPDDLLNEGDLGKISAFINARTFGNKHTRGVGGNPATLAMFDPGEVWIVESRQVSHQVLYGRRAVSTDFAIAPESMKFPERHYLAITQKHVDQRRRHAAPSSQPSR